MGKKDRIIDVAIIGGGAAGMMAALAAKPAGGNIKVTVFEKMPRPGRKILVTGKGRCNLTNACGWEEFSTHIHPDAGLLRYPFEAFSPSDTISFFKKIGLECVTQRGRRVFPASMKAMDVVDALVRALKAKGVEIRCGCKAVGIVKDEDGTFTIRCANGQVAYSKAVIISTGGLSYPATGSEGDGYVFAEDFGHRITPCFPSLTALRPAGYNMSSRWLRGLHLINICMRLYVDGNMVQEETGELDFTDGGIEGALGFRVSRKAVQALRNGSAVKARIDLKPALSDEQLQAKGNLPIEKLLPAAIARAFMATNKANIRHYGLNSSLKRWDFAIESHTGYERAVITAGGVPAKEINPKTMESKFVPGLFFAGEIIDLDGDTGGYNLQIAWATGNAAGKSAAERYAQK